MLKGDVGLFRGALLLSGFFDSAECIIFNDRHKDGTRRLKLWSAAAVFGAPQEQQKALEKFLREAFSSRIRDMYFAFETDGYGRYTPWRGQALCIQLWN